MGGWRAADPGALRVLAREMDDGAAALAAARRQIEEALASAGVSDTAPSELAAVETWLRDEAGEARRRAGGVEEGEHDPTADVHPPGLGAGRCVSVLVPVHGRRLTEPRRHAALGHPFWAGAPLGCTTAKASPRRRPEAEEWSPLPVLGALGRLVFAKRPGRRRQPSGADGQDGETAAAPVGPTSPKRLEERYLKRLGIDAHDEKDKMQAGRISRYDIYVDKKDGELWRGRKGGRRSTFEPMYGRIRDGRVEWGPRKS